MMITKLLYIKMRVWCGKGILFKYGKTMIDIKEIIELLRTKSTHDHSLDPSQIGRSRCKWLHLTVLFLCFFCDKSWCILREEKHYNP